MHLLVSSVNDRVLWPKKQGFNDRGFKHLDIHRNHCFDATLYVLTRVFVILLPQANFGKGRGL